MRLLFLLTLWAGTGAAQSALPRFETQTIDSAVAIGYGLAIGDVDGDGKQDILLADKKSFVWYRNGDWKRFVLAENLTQHDNVCIAARDIDGDGKVEVAVGAQWNPGETNDAAASGSVHYLQRPANPTALWQPLRLHHEPTVHRMQWVLLKEGAALVVAPLHGRGNRGGEGAGARLLAYYFPKGGEGAWRIDTLENTMHLTHNFDVLPAKEETILLAGKEGLRTIASGGHSALQPAGPKGAGEVRTAPARSKGAFTATIEPMHGNELVIYSNGATRTVLDSTLREGHALAVADLLGTGTAQVVAGWRLPDAQGKVGIRLYVPGNSLQNWKAHWIDDNGMACEDLKVADLDGDGRLDIIASGRASHNLKIYWNKGQ